MRLEILLASNILLISIPIYILYRLKKSGIYIFFNVLLYLVILSYTYLCIPSIFLNAFLDSPVFSFLLTTTARLSLESFESVFIYSQWAVLVFFLAYFLSKDNKVSLSFDFHPKKITCFLAKVFIVMVSLIYLSIFIVYIPEVWPSFLRADRFNLLRLYAEAVNAYRFATVTFILIGAVAVITWKTRKFSSYFLFLLPISFELLTLGRTMTFQIMVFSYLNYVAIVRKPRYLAALAAFLLVASTVILRTDSSELDVASLLFYIFSDPFLTYFGSILTYQEFFDQSSIDILLVSSILKILPFTVSRFFAGSLYGDDTFVSVTKEYYVDTVGFGLANNIISEAAFYGGDLFLIISPLVIAYIFYSLNSLRLINSLPGFVFILILIASSRHMIAQSGFYLNFFPLVYLMFTYLLWLTYFERKSKSQGIVPPKGNFDQVSMRD